jgi:hypothetical protein
MRPAKSAAVASVSARTRVGLLGASQGSEIALAVARSSTTT